MFERFTGDARQVVLAAHEQARALGADSVGPVHLLLALTDDPTRGGTALRAAGLDHDRVRSAIVRTTGSTGLDDAGALATLGIDLDLIRERAEAAFGPGALDALGATTHPNGRLRFSEASRQVLAHALRQTFARSARTVDTGAVLLGVLAAGDPAVTGVLQVLGADAEQLRRRLSGESDVA